MAAFKIGVVRAETRAGLGLATTQHLGLATTDPDLEKNIGRLVDFLPRSGQGTIHRERHRIVGVQKMWGTNLETGVYEFGRIGYRVTLADSDNFGRCALPEDIAFV